ncbi:DNA-binding protein [Hydrogenophaga sp.]|uniref:DNA-binding protein n=1 Tax=Hydrogenophaga sp. TaxID=1904254 RepID=UPI003AF5DB33
MQVDEVWAAADAVLAQGERPTIERVRTHLGRGSPNTVAPMLDAWYASLGKRLDAGNSGDGAGEKGTLPAPVLRAARALWGRAQQHAQEKAAESVRIDRSMLEQQVEGLAATRNELDQEQQKLDERSEALGAALLAKDQQIADLVRQLTALQKSMVSREAEVEQLRVQIATTTSALHAERGRLDALTEEHRLERGRLEQRAHDQEKRLLEEIDRSRQEAKRLKLMQAGESRQANQELAGAQEQVQSLRVDVAALRSENAGLAREVLLAREDLRTAQSQQEQFRKDTTALLAELKSRVTKNVASAEPAAARRSKLKAAPSR